MRVSCRYMAWLTIIGTIFKGMHLKGIIRQPLHRKAAETRKARHFNCSLCSRTIAEQGRNLTRLLHRRKGHEQ